MNRDVVVILIHECFKVMKDKDRMELYCRSLTHCLAMNNKSLSTQNIQYSLSGKLLFTKADIQGVTI